MAVSLATVVGEMSPLTITAGMAEPAGARVPGPHRTFGVEPDDLVVGDAVDHLLEATQRDLLHEPFGQVSDNLDVSLHHPVAVLDRAEDDGRPEPGAVPADPPALRLIPAGLRGGPQLDVGPGPRGPVRQHSVVQERNICRSV